MSLVDDLRRTAPHLDLKGLMTMAPYDAPEDQLKMIFRQMRELREKVNLPGLSMGMSGDFETAIQEGSTLLRIGSAFFRTQTGPRGV